jgi:hypothetical protein
MALLDASRGWWLTAAPLPADDAYAAWFNANSRCSEALREWRGASTDDRAAAYLSYVAALDREEAAAAELVRRHAMPRAA